MAETKRAEEKSRNLSDPDQFWRGAIWSAGGLLVLAVLLYVVFWLPYRQPRSSATLPKQIQRLPKPPLTSAAEEPALSNYDWVDREAGIVTIPVEVAMEALVEKLPVREGAKKAWEERTKRVIPTDAGSGRFARPKGEP